MSRVARQHRARNRPSPGRHRRDTGHQGAPVQSPTGQLGSASAAKPASTARRASTGTCFGAGRTWR